MSAETPDCYQISDDEDADNTNGREMGEDSLLEEMNSCPITEATSDIPVTDEGNAQEISYERGTYERTWSTEATRALIHIRGPLEYGFAEGRHRRTALWLQCARQMQKLGYRYSAAKVQKKWHNILITYNKNLRRKQIMGTVNWEFFEEMFNYLKGKQADLEQLPRKNEEQSRLSLPLNISETHPEIVEQQRRKRSLTSATPLPPKIAKIMSQVEECAVLQPTRSQRETKSSDEFNEDDGVEPPDENVKPFQMPPASQLNASSTTDSVKLDLDLHDKLVNHVGSADQTDWWRDYFIHKQQLDREKLQTQREMHREFMQFSKMALLQQEKIERVKIEAINSLTATLQQLADAKGRKG